MNPTYTDPRTGNFYVAVKHGFWNMLWNTLPPEERFLAEESELSKCGIVVMRKLGRTYFIPCLKDDGTLASWWDATCLAAGMVAPPPPPPEISNTKFAPILTAFGQCWWGRDLPNRAMFGVEVYREYVDRFGEPRFNGVPVIEDQGLPARMVRLVNDKFPGDPKYNAEVAI